MSLSCSGRGIYYTGGNKRFQRKVSSALLNKNTKEEFKKLSFKQSQAFLEELDAWLTQNEVEPDDRNAHYASLGIHYYEHQD